MPGWTWVHIGFDHLGSFGGHDVGVKRLGARFGTLIRSIVMVYSTWLGCLPRTHSTSLFSVSDDSNDTGYDLKKGPRAMQTSLE